MGYDLHITRKDNWSDPQGPIITESEFRELVRKDRELSINQSNSGDGLIFADWNGGPEWIAWTKGEIHAKNPKPPLVAKMIQLAATLDAKAQGDDGEILSAPPPGSASTTPPPLADVFKAQAGHFFTANAQLAAAVALLLWVPVGFKIALGIDDGVQFKLHLLTTLPAIIAVGLLRSYFSIRKTPVTVGVSESGVDVTFAGGQTKQLTWAQVGWVKVDLIPPHNTRTLTLFDAGGKKAIQIADSISRFDLLVQRLEDGVARKPDPSVAESIKTSKARKSAYITLIAGLILPLLAGLFVWMNVHEANNLDLLEHHSIPIIARVTQLKMAPDGRTPRLYYTITPTGSTPVEHNAHVTQELYDSTKLGDSIPAVYVPADPGLTRLASDEIPDGFPPSPLVNILTPIGLVLLGILCLVDASLKFRGKGIDLDSQTGQLSIKPFGEGR